MGDRCPTCGQTLKPRKGGLAFERIKAVLNNDDRDEWTTGDLAFAAGLNVDKTTHNAIEYMVRIGKLRRLHRGAFLRGAR